MKRAFKVAYAAGPGDVINTYRHWLGGEADPHEVSETYSGQFYSAMRELSMEAYVVASHSRRELLRNGWISLEHRPRTSRGKRGLAYHLAELGYWLVVMRSIVRAKADVAVVSDMDHWWLLTLLRLANIRVMPTLHCTFWPRERRPTGTGQRIVQWLNGWFWRHVPVATLSISPECERQVLELAGPRVKGVLIQARAHYHRGYLDTIPPADWCARPFRLLFAGRMERNKGIFDLLEMAERLQDDIPGEFVIEVCGSGSAQGEFVAEVERRQLSSVVRFLGRLDHGGMWDAYARAHMVVVPTAADFAEGLNKVVVEGVLAGRPVVATEVCNAGDVMEHSVLQVPAGDVEAMGSAVLRLARDRACYEQQRAYCAEEAKPFYDASQSWGGALRQALTMACGVSSSS